MRTFSRFLGMAALIGCLSLPLIAQAQITDQQFADMLEKYIKTDKGRASVGSTVEEYFRSRQEEARKQQESRAQQDVEDQFKNPVKIDIGSSPVKGPADAKVTIIEFSDFQCPYCKRGADTMAEVMKAYPKDVKVAFKNLPLPFHKDARPAAQAALAAGKQGKFWEMHDALFENQRSLSKEFYLAKAKELGLNVDQFTKDMESDEIKKQIDADSELGAKNGIQGTPGFFVNGVAVRGAYPFDHFKGIIDRWISGNPAAAQAANAAGETAEKKS